MYTPGWREALWCSTEKASSARAQTWTTCSGVKWTSHEAITAEISLKKTEGQERKRLALKIFLRILKNQSFKKLGIHIIILTHCNMIIWQPWRGNSELFQHIWVGKNFFNLINNNIKRIYSVNNFPKRIQM